MSFLVLIIIAVIIFFIVKSRLNKKKEEELSPSLLVKNSINSKYIALKDDCLSTTKVSDYPIKNVLFSSRNNRLSLIRLDYSLKGEADNVNKACDYLEKHGATRSFAEAPLKLGKTEINSLNLDKDSKNTKLCLSNAQEKTCVFSGDPALTPYRLIEINFTPKYETTTHTQTKGHTGRAIAGGILAGPVGAIAGGAGKKKSSTTSSTIEQPAPCSLCFVNLKTNTPNEIVVQTRSDIVKVLRESFLKRDLTGNTSKENSSSTVSLDDLRKLKEMVDEGILTQEEFDAKKKQILGL